MKLLTRLSIFLIIGLVSCKPTTIRQEKIEKKVSKEENTKQDGLNTDNSHSNETESECIRGEAHPIIKKNIYPHSTFVMQPDSLTAFEYLSFENKDKLIIHNYGCEYYILTFRFETARFLEDIKNLPFWFRKSASLMSEINDGIDTPFDIKKGLEKLNQYIDNDSSNDYKNLKFGEQIDFGDEDIRSFITVDKIEKLTAKKYAVEISFALGPL
jgi:hypothetical protein